jgi:hypothetical protein
MKKNLKFYIFNLGREIRANRMYAIVWSIALLTVLIMNVSTKNTYTFVGVTDSKEVQINSKHAVDIKEIKVIPGQFVKKGELLLKFERGDLKLRLNEVSHKLKGLVAEYKFNSGLNKNLKSVKLNKVNTEDNQIEIEIKSLEIEMDMLYAAEDELSIFSPIDGHIGSVNFKVGESVSPFSSVITMHKKTPTYVRGYIHENISNKVRVNSKVIVTSKNEKNKIKARVSSVGTRIIEFPERFRRSADAKIWGREIVVKISARNKFLLGEKVFIKLENKKDSLSIIKSTIANEDIGDTNPDKIILMNTDAVKGYPIEPSGVVYMEEMNRYLFISDDNPKGLPLLYVMDQNGVVEPKPRKITGLGKMKDVEGLTRDENGNLYIISSLSASKKGRTSKYRSILAKIEYEGNEFKLVSKINLLKRLKTVVKSNPDKKWAKILLNSHRSVETDIEGLAVHDNTIYLGLRNQIGKRKKIAIISIKNIDKLFNTKKLNESDLDVFSFFKLPANRKSDKNEGISGLVVNKDNVLFTTANNKNNSMGRILSMKNGDSTGKTIREIKYYDRNRPEGLTINNNKIIVVFDNNESDSDLYISRIPRN